jgi:hypothetical protein
VFTVSAAALRQSITPPSLLGRVSSVARVLALGTAPVALVAGGALASAVGLRAALWIGATGALLTPLPVLLSRVPALRDMPDADDLGAHPPVATIPSTSAP